MDGVGHGSFASIPLSHRGEQGFSGNAPELRFEHRTSNTIVMVDGDGDGTADMHIQLDDIIALSRGDFML